MLKLDDKSKQGHQVKINKIQEYDPNQIKKEELSGDISKFPPVQCALRSLRQLKSRSPRGASRQPAFMGNCPTINHKC